MVYIYSHLRKEVCNMKKEKYEAPKAVVVDFENDYVVALPSGGFTSSEIA